MSFNIIQNDSMFVLKNGYSNAFQQLQIIKIEDKIHTFLGPKALIGIMKDANKERKILFMNV